MPTIAELPELQQKLAAPTATELITHSVYEYPIVVGALVLVGILLINKILRKKR